MSSSHKKAPFKPDIPSGYTKPSKELESRLIFLHSLFNKIKINHSIFGEPKTVGDLETFLESDTYGWDTNQLTQALTYEHIEERYKTSVLQEWAKSGDRCNKPEPFVTAEGLDLGEYSKENRVSQTSSSNQEQVASSGILQTITPQEADLSIPRQQLGVEEPKYLTGSEVQLWTSKESVEKLGVKSAQDLIFVDGEHDRLDKWYNKPLPKISRSCDLFWFQTKAANMALDGIFRYKRRAQLINSGTGSGKTFIAGAIIEALWDKKLDFFKSCFSAWPVMYITRASIVTQTARVMEDKFGLDPVRQCFVLNVEQLRSQFGTMLLKEQTVIRQGVADIEWQWHELMHPRVVIVDESHLGKNSDSTQSKIIQALSTIKSEIYIIFMSATAFMRVSEAKYFAVNTHKVIK